MSDSICPLKEGHLLLLTATPHKGDPDNFTLFLQLLDADAYADVRSIQQGMNRQRAPFYLRRTKEPMVYFPERRDDGSWVVQKIFTKRIPVTHCSSEPILEEPIRDPAQFPWHEVTKVQHYYLDVDGMTQPMQVREHPPGYGGVGK